MCKTCPVVVADGRKEYLCFTFKSAEGVAVEYAVAVALELGAVRALVLVAFTRTC